MLMFEFSCVFMFMLDGMHLEVWHALGSLRVMVYHVES